MFFLSAASLLLTILGAEARVIKLNLKADEDSGFWRKINCTYKEDYVAYNKSCITLMKDSPAETEFQDKHGLWSPCGQGSCELIYYGGLMLQPESIKVSGLVQGNGKIKVQGKRSAIGNNWDFDMVEFLKQPEGTFQEFTRTNTYFPNAYAFRILLIANSANSVAVLDYVEIDLGDSVLESVSETTKAPAPPQTDFLLETKADAESNWDEISCNYADLAEDLWVWGCSADLVGTQGKLGFWSPCATSSCNFVFNAKQNFINPQAVTIKGNLDKGGTITFSHRSKKVGSKSVQIACFKLDEDKTDFTYEIPYLDEDQLFSVTITSVNRSKMLIDSLFVHLHNGVMGETTVTDTDTNTTPPPRETHLPTFVEESISAAYAMPSYNFLIIVATLSVLAL